MARLLIVEDNPELASLMGAAAQERGHQVHIVHSGAQALARAREGGLDAAVVDLLLPDMRGTDVLEALHPLGIPALAVSGVFKGEQLAREATERHGARAFFEKPFELAGLLDALEAQCGGPPPLPPLPHFPEPAEDDALIIDLEELARLPPEATQASVPLEPGGHRLPLPFTERAKVWGSAGAPGGARRPPPAWSLAGDLRHTSVPRLLNAYYEARHDGELRLQQHPVLKVVYFEAGRPVYAASNLAHERFGRFCVRRGVLDEARLAEVAALARAEGLRTGEALLRLGVLDAAQRRALLEAQVKDILWATFGWTEGGYGFSAARPVGAHLVKLSLFPGDLILEGVLRTETLLGLRRQLPATRRLFPTTAPPYALHELTLTDAQALLLAHADGSKTVEDLLALTDLPEREALGALRAYELMGLLEERREEAGGRRITFGL